MEAKEHSY